MMRARLKSVFLLVAAAVLPPITSTRAQDVPASSFARPVRAVIELFTSQGCSSCPPADALLQKYAQSPDVIALSLPVDYWDYLGWKDTLASPRNSERQRTYSRLRGDGAVYTPQVVVNGMTHVIGSSRPAIDKAIENDWPRFSRSLVPVRFWLQGGAVIIETGAAPEGNAVKEATIWLAIVQKSATVSILRGENSTKSVTYTNIVRQLAPVGLWTGTPTTITLARHAIMKPDTEACAVLIQQNEAGPIIGAAWMGL